MTIPESRDSPLWEQMINSCPSPQHLPAHFTSLDVAMLSVYLGETEKTIPDKQFLPPQLTTGCPAVIVNKQWGLLLLLVALLLPFIVLRVEKFQTYLRL